MSWLKPTTFEQRTSYYEDIRALLNPGFLSHIVTVNGVSIALRSLGPGDFFLLQQRVGTSSKDKSWKVWSLAMAIWMIDGQVLLGESSSTYRLYEMCVGFPRAVRDDLFSNYTGLMNRVNTSMSRLEAYLYEEESRYYWKSEGRRLFDVSILPEAPRMGLNSVQKLWAFFNDIEDVQDKRRHDWAMTKFLVSPHAPKGIKKLNASDATHEKAEKERRQKVMDTMFYKALGQLKEAESGTGLLGPIHSLNAASTVDELSAEMRNWVAGKRDFHDQVVLQTKANIRRKHEEEEQARLQRIREVREALDAEGIAEPAFAPLMGEARHEAIHRLRRKGPAKVYQDSTHNSAYDKYIKEDAEVGLLSVQNDQIVVQNADQVPHEDLLEAMKFSDNKESLMDQVKARGKPTLHPSDQNRKG